jgi:hypothetical protein
MGRPETLRRHADLMRIADLREASIGSKSSLLGSDAIVAAASGSDSAQASRSALRAIHVRPERRALGMAPLLASAHATRELFTGHFV